MENVTNEQSNLDSLIKENVSEILKDPELRKLKPGSDEFKTGVETKFNNKDSASVTETSPKVKVEEGETDDEKVNVSHNVQKRFDKLTKQRQEAREEADKLKARIQELESKHTPKEEVKTQTIPESSFNKSKPSMGDFDTLANYNEALWDWKAEKKDFDTKVESQRQEHLANVDKIINNFRSNGATIEKELGLQPGEFDVIVGSDDFIMTDMAKQAFFESPYGAQIAFDIASDDTLKQDFASMSSLRQVAYIGKLETKFENSESSSKTKQKLTQAKRPDAKIPKGGKTTPSSVAPTNPSDYKSWRNAQRIAKGLKPYD